VSVPSLHVNGQPYQYETEATAGLNLSTGEKWWGTRIRFRLGLQGRWSWINLIGIHPLDVDTVQEALAMHITGRGR